MGRRAGGVRSPRTDPALAGSRATLGWLWANYDGREDDMRTLEAEAKTLCLRDFNGQNMDIVVQMIPEFEGYAATTEDEEIDLSEEEMDDLIDPCCDMVDD